MIATLFRFKEYTIAAAVEHGLRYTLLITDEKDDYLTLWTNHQLSTKFQQFVKEHAELYQKASGFIFSTKENLATLTVTGRAVNEYGNWNIYTKLKFLVADSAEAEDEEEEITDCKELSNIVLQDSETNILLKARNDLLPYPDNPSLATLPLNIIKPVGAIGKVGYRGKERLLVEVEGVMYQAGADLENKMTKLEKNCYLRIDKIKRNRSTRSKEAICTIIRNGEWHLLLQYGKCNMYRSCNPLCTRVLDVRNVEVEGVKRKLALTENGQVVRFSKKSKMDKDIIVGEIL